jgi:hypothetical protein
MSRKARPADFDSASAMVAATARFLRGRDFPILGKPWGHLLRPVLVGCNQLPAPARQWLYRAGSGREGLAAEVVAGLEEEQLARQVVRRYPRRVYPGALVGSTPGSAVHLAAAMRMPLLPQTLLIPLAHDPIPLDDPCADIDAARPVAEALLERNPHLVVHHMADPANDRKTLARFSYFRLKRTNLGPAYEDFLAHSVEPGGVLYLVESRHRWPTTTFSPRYVFQFGGVGALRPEEYLQGGERVTEFLRRERSPVPTWSPPEPNGEEPEAEWGFEPELADDVERFAAEHGFRVVRLCFDEADSLSPFVAELHRWWYGRLGRPTRRLFVESFVLIDPYWVLRAGAVPYWATFNTEVGVEHLCAYLDQAEPYDLIEATLVSNGTTTPGEAGPPAWEPVLGRARLGGRLAGVDPERFPSDLAVFARYRDTLRKSAVHYPLPPPLEPAEMEKFAELHAERYGVEMG